MLKMYCFANPGFSIHEGPDGYHWAVWTLRGGLTGVEAGKLEALAAIKDAREHYPFAQEPASAGLTNEEFEQKLKEWYG